MLSAWLRRSLLLLALLLQLAAANTANTAGAFVELAMSSLPSSDAWADAVDGQHASSFDTAASDAADPSMESNTLEQDTPLDDGFDTELALAPEFGVQLRAVSTATSSCAPDLGARRAALEALFKPPRA